MTLACWPRHALPSRRSGRSLEFCRGEGTARCSADEPPTARDAGAVLGPRLARHEDRAPRDALARLPCNLVLIRLHRPAAGPDIRPADPLTVPRPGAGHR